jgi:hypothetical protein
MTKFSNTIKLFDIYGSYFNLRINNQAKFKSTIGGLFSIITMGIFLFCILNFGKNFYYKINPKISIQESFLPDDAPYITTGGSYENKTIIFSYSADYKNVLLPILLNINGGSPQQFVLEECDEAGISMLKNYLSNEPLLETNYLFYCMRLNDFYLGTNSLSQRANTPVLTVSLQHCSGIDPNLLNTKNITCNSDYLVNNTIDSFMMMVYFEKYGFVPQDVMPFTTRLSSFQYLFHNTIMSKVEIPLILNTLQDDRGIISSDVNTYSVLNVDSFLQYNYAYDSKIPLGFIYFYISEKNCTYLRSYEKLQDLMAAIGGFMKLIFTALNILNFIIRAYLIDMHIVDTLFRKEDAESDFYQSLKGNLSMDTIKSSIY